MADGLLTSLARFVRTLGQGRTFDSLNGMTQGRKLATRTSASSLPLVDESALAPAAPFTGRNDRLLGGGSFLRQRSGMTPDAGLCHRHQTISINRNNRSGRKAEVIWLRAGTPDAES